MRGAAAAFAPVSRARSRRETVFSSRFLCCSGFLPLSCLAAGFASAFAGSDFFSLLASGFFSAFGSAFFSAGFASALGALALFRNSSRFLTLLSLLNFSSR